MTQYFADSSALIKRLVAAGVSPLHFVSADGRLLVAAAAEGLMTESPQAHS